MPCMLVLLVLLGTGGAAGGGLARRSRKDDPRLQGPVDEKDVTAIVAYLARIKSSSIW